MPLIAPEFLKAVVHQFLLGECNEAQKGAYTGVEWTLQGLGQLRAYMGTGKFRLHVWDSRYRVADVTMLHDHPWDFDSVCVAGKVENTRYVTTNFGLLRDYMEQSIVCGAGGGVCAEPVPVTLEAHSFETVYPGFTYTQHADEIHKSEPEDGTITLIERTFRPDTEVAHVYYEASKGWVSAEPRKASAEEVYDILRASLERWF